MRSRTKKSGYDRVDTKINDADGLTKTVNKHVTRNMLTTLKIELLETSKDHVSMNLIVCENNLIGTRRFRRWQSGRVNPNSGHKKIVMDGRENWHKKIVMYGREQLQNSTRGARGVNPSTGHTNILMGCSEN